MFWILGVSLSLLASGRGSSSTNSQGVFREAQKQAGLFLKGLHLKDLGRAPLTLFSLEGESFERPWKLQGQTDALSLLHFKEYGFNFSVSLQKGGQLNLLWNPLQGIWTFTLKNRSLKVYEGSCDGSSWAQDFGVQGLSEPERAFLKPFEKAEKDWAFFSHHEVAKEGALHWEDTVLPNLVNLCKNYEAYEAKFKGESEEPNLFQAFIEELEERQVHWVRMGAAFQWVLFPCLWMQRIFQYFEKPLQPQGVEIMVKLFKQEQASWFNLIESSPHRAVWLDLTQQSIKSLVLSDETKLLALQTDLYEEEYGFGTLHRVCEVRSPLIWMLFLKFHRPTLANLDRLERRLNQGALNWDLFVWMNESTYCIFKRLVCGFSKVAECEKRNSYFAQFTGFIYTALVPAPYFWRSIIQTASSEVPLKSANPTADAQFARLLSVRAKHLQVHLGGLPAQLQSLDKAKHYLIEKYASTSQHDPMVLASLQKELHDKHEKIFWSKTFSIPQSSSLESLEEPLRPVDLTEEKRLIIFQSQCSDLDRLAEYTKKAQGVIQKELSVFEYTQNIIKLAEEAALKGLKAPDSDLQIQLAGNYPKALGAEIFEKALRSEEKKIADKLEYNQLCHEVEELRGVAQEKLEKVQRIVNGEVVFRSRERGFWDNLAFVARPAFQAYRVANFARATYENIGTASSICEICETSCPYCCRRGCCIHNPVCTMQKLKLSVG